MGGKVRGTRIMVTISEDTYPVVQELAQHLDQPVATMVRTLIDEMRPTLIELNKGLDAAKAGKLQGLLNFHAAVAAAQSHLQQQQALQLQELSEAVKNSQKMPQTPE